MVVTIQKQEQHAAIYKFWVETIAENTDEKERKNTP
jgi:hypothetical protein